VHVSKTELKDQGDLFVRNISQFYGFGTIVLGFLMGAGQASATNTLCAPSEEVFFSCQVQGSPKLLSVCGRAGEEARRGAAAADNYLQYRFGPHDKPELIYPKTRDGSLEKFWAASEYLPSAFYEGYQLSFQSGETEYRVYAMSEGAGPDVPPEKYGGVIVSTAGGKDITIPCGSSPENKLSALVRKFGVAHREGQSHPADFARASFQLCQAMPLNSSDSDFKPGTTEYVLRPLNDAFMLGLHNTPEVIELSAGAAERLAAKPRHGSLAANKKTAGKEVAWTYTPAPGFVGNDRAEFVVRGKSKKGEAVEFRLIYKLRVTPEKARAYLPQPDPPLLSVSKTYCPVPTILLDFVGRP
jgi:hypothetical protein